MPTEDIPRDVAAHLPADGRTRNWSFVIYPESVPDDWREQLEQLHTPGLVSPLHDKDENPTGEPKKAHRHVILCWTGKKSYSQVKRLTDALCAPHPQPVSDVVALARYLCHMDNPSKAQYDPQDVISLGGMDYLDTVAKKSDKYPSIREMMEFVDSNGVIYFCDLLDYAAKRNEQWFRCLCDNGGYVMREYVKSKSFKWRSSFEPSSDGAECSSSATGEDGTPREGSDV